MRSENPSLENFTPTILTADCPGCGGTSFVDGPLLTGQPVMLNYRCLETRQAKELGRGEIVLRECQTCGLIFNAAFDLEMICYDAAYDNRQGFSKVFREHLESVADSVMEQLPSGGRVLEVGCGKGEFLRLLRDRGARRCVGYDTSCPDGLDPEDAGIEYHRSYVTAENVGESFDLIVCRHVVEHVSEIGWFLTSLSEIAKAAGNALVVIETPEFGWIIRNGCFWDYFYEHCNYFTFEALGNLCKRAGLDVISHKHVFGDQYQLIVAKPSCHGQSEVKTLGGSLSRFIAAIDSAQNNLEGAIEAVCKGDKWAIWGAGAKGVTLASRLSVKGLTYVIDSNPAKVGCYLPGSAVPVISPVDPRIPGLSLIVIANPMYETEIRDALRGTNFCGKIIAA